MVRINLLPVRVSKKKEAGKQQLVLFAVLLLAGVVGNVMWTANRADELKKKEANVAKTRADVARLDAIIGEVNSLKTQQEELQKKLDVLEKLKNGRTGPVKMLDELAQITPKRLWLRSMQEKDGRVTFDGTASSNYDVSQFMENLLASKYFGDVELKKTSARSDGAFRVVDFTITASARYSGAPAGDGGPGAADARKVKG
ncbi:PilN domain-containing protein [Anaeromyxobacter oryzae]|uniref:Fimbrial protein n=1 Tax=Anaeromyxobacter oryzae TaxID=2918170 RepID=A0ABM7WXP9_9BACT|nr:PilN domain-containing protein [Anaeromyxobacter oryzae]BDG04298.1 fimbrial protein [Anaeromyxobacter oryzae]